MAEDVTSLQSVWRSAELRSLVTGRLFASIAEWMWYTVATVYAFTLSGVDGVGAIAVAAVFPPAFLSPAMGYVIDRFPRERVLAAMLALRFVSLIAAVVSAAFFPSVGVLVGVAVAEGVASLFVRPTTAALLPSVTRRPEDFVRAHAALSFADNIGVLVGPLSGGFILAGTTPATAFATAAVLALLSLVVTVRVRVDATGVVELTPTTGLRHALSEATRGVRDVAGRDVRPVALLTALAFAVSGASDVFVVPLAIDELGWGEAGTGVLMACIAGGGLIAGVLLGMIGQRRLGPWFLGAGVTMGIALALIGALPIAVVVMPATIALGAGGLLVETASQVQVQTLIPSSAGGRVLGTLEGLSYFAIAAGVWATTKMIDGWSLRTCLFALASIAAASTVALAWAVLRADAKVAQTRERIGALDGIRLFAPLPNVLRERISAQLDTVDVPAGGVVTYQGEYGDSFYVVEAGTLEVFVDSRQVRSLGAGDFFGEVALLADTTRTATVRAATDCRLWVLPGRVFLAVLTGFAGTGHVITAASTERQAIMPVGANDRDDPLARVPLFAYLDRDTVRDLEASATTARYDAATVVFRENDPAGDAYFIVGGRVDFDRAGESFRTFGPGMLFGEGTALRPGATRAATATAAPGTVLLQIPGEQVRAAVTRS
jgi:CRP-like cAMP-binding protein/predicted MFS family arabinose efflux permease